MKNNPLNKSLVFGIITLFVVASVGVSSSAAVFTKTEAKRTIGSFREISLEIQEIKQLKTKVHSFKGDDVLISSLEGDDILPSITKDKDGYTVVTWSNELYPEWEEGYMGIAYATDPTDSDDWTSYVFCILDATGYSDIAKITGPGPDDFNGLMGVCMVYDIFDGWRPVYYIIEDITDPNWWEFYYVSNNETPEPRYACIADSGFYQNIYNPDLWGPFSFYIYRWQNQSSDIPGCPVWVHQDLGDWGTIYPDAQIAPAVDADLAPLSDRIHIVIGSEQGDTVVWKKVVPSETPDIASTPYQMVIDDASGPSIVATEDGRVVIVYTSSDGHVKCSYSKDDGDTWETATIAEGAYPDISYYDCLMGDVFTTAYVRDGNLYCRYSPNGGATWGCEAQINDMDGTVVAEPNSVDIHGNGIVWVDSRGGDYDIYFDEIYFPADLKISIETGIRTDVLATIINHGCGWAFDVGWTIRLEGGLILWGRETTGVIEYIIQWDWIESRDIFGIGRVEINVTAESYFGFGDEKHANGFVLGPFVFIPIGRTLCIPGVYSGSYETFFTLIEEHQGAIWNNILEVDKNHEGEYTEDDLVWFLLAVFPDDFFNQENMQNNQYGQSNNKQKSLDNQQSSIAQRSTSSLLERILALHSIFTRLLNLRS